MKEQIERRFIPLETVELRATGDLQMDGYAAVFNVKVEIASFWGAGWLEEVAPGAFAKTIQENDIRALWNHDPNIVLGRNRAKTLELSEDAHGLKSVISPPDNAWGRPVVDAVRRGDVTGMSISFRAIKQEWIQPAEGSKDLARRIIREAKLYDVSPVTFPAFESTFISARSAQYGLDIDDREESDLEKAGRLVFCHERGMPLTQADYLVIKAASEKLFTLIPAPEPLVMDAEHSDAARANEPGAAKPNHSRVWRVRELELIDLELSWHQNADH